MTSTMMLNAGLAALSLTLAGCNAPTPDAVEAPEPAMTAQSASTPVISEITADQAGRIQSASRVEAEFVACGILTPEALARVAPGKRRILAPGVDPVAHDALYDIAFSESTQAYSSASAAEKTRICQRARATAAEIAGMRAEEAPPPTARSRSSLEEAQAAVDRVDRKMDERNR